MIFNCFSILAIVKKITGHGLNLHDFFRFHLVGQGKKLKCLNAIIHNQLDF